MLTSLRRIGLGVFIALLICDAIGLYLAHQRFYFLPLSLRFFIEDVLCFGVMGLFAILATYQKRWFGRVIFGFLAAFFLFALCLPRI